MAIKTQSEVDALEKTFEEILTSFDSCDTEEDFREVVQDSRKKIEGELREIRKDKWIIRARCEDGTCFWHQNSWHEAWYKAQLFDSEVEAQVRIEVLKKQPTDEVMGSFKAVML